VDIKDFILIGGGLLIAAVIAHGFWIAWRGRREPLRLDIVPDIIADDVDDIVRLRGELPNGGARVVARESVGEQEIFELEPASGLLEPTLTSSTMREAEIPQEEVPRNPASQIEASQMEDSDKDVSDPEPSNRAVGSAQRQEPTTGAPGSRPKVTEVIVPEESPQPPLSEPVLPEQTRSRRRPAARKDVEKAPEPIAEQPPVEELIVMNVLARHGEAFTGDQVFAALRGKGLRFGDMNIFHRGDSSTRIINYSVANIVEPGTFDMADMEAFRSPGLCFFLQLPGPDHPARVFEDMVSVARDVATQLKGELKDEQRSFVTPQTIEHYRQRIADFTRRRMSKRA
jgi:cell division protein ZipA